MSVTATMPSRSGSLAGVRKPAKDCKASYMPLTPEKTPRSSPATSASALAHEQRPTTPTSPVQIPVKAARHETAHAHKTKHRHHQNADSRRGLCHGQPQPWSTGPSRRSSRDIHSPDAIPPSVAALLAVTSIPPPRPYRSLRQSRNNSGDRLSEKRMTVNSIIERAQEAEQEFSLSLSKSPLDVLLTAPEDLEDEDGMSIVSDSTMEPGLSTRAVSLESMPSLSDSFATGTVSSCDSPFTPVRNLRGRKARPTRKSMTPISSPPGERCNSDPLSVPSIDGDSDSEAELENLDFRVFQSPDPLAKTTEARFPLQPLKSAFKSNLTASLRALRNAARSFSNLNLTSSIPPEDFLTRSILTIDPRIPYTDERRPPPLEEEPSAALRRYLNPTAGVHIDPRTSAAQLLSSAMASASLTPFAPNAASAHGSGNGGAAAGSASSSRSAFTASIQMQTYRVHRSKNAPSSRSPGSPGSSSPSSANSTGKPEPVCGNIDDRQCPGPRQRELRENSDFIRIAVMEMAMRRVGKLDDRKPGRARLALPPRKMAGKPYVVGSDGVPARWIGVISE